MKLSKNTITEFINRAKEQEGVIVAEDSHFKGIETRNGKSWFSLDLGEHCWDSAKYVALEKMANRCKDFKVEPNGVERVAIIL